MTYIINESQCQDGKHRKRKVSSSRKIPDLEQTLRVGGKPCTILLETDILGKKCLETLYLEGLFSDGEHSARSVPRDTATQGGSDQR